MFLVIPSPMIASLPAIGRGKRDDRVHATAVELRLNLTVQTGAQKCRPTCGDNQGFSVRCPSRVIDASLIFNFDFTQQLAPRGQNLHAISVLG